MYTFSGLLTYDFSSRSVWSLTPNAKVHMYACIYNTKKVLSLTKYKCSSKRHIVGYNFKGMLFTYYNLNSSCVRTFNNKEAYFIKEISNCNSNS